MVVVLDQEQVDELEQAYGLPAKQPEAAPPIPIVGGLEDTPETFKKRRRLMDLLQSVSPAIALPHIQALDLTPGKRPEGWGIGVNPEVAKGWPATSWGLEPLTLPERELLVAADELLSDRSVWIQRKEHSRNVIGRNAFCAIGAVRWAAGFRYKTQFRYDHDEAANVIFWLDVFSEKRGSASIVRVNDHEGYDAMREVFGVTRNYFNVGRY